MIGGPPTLSPDSSSSGSRPPAATSLLNPTVLLVEDNAQMARLEKTILERAGFEVTLVKTGPDGLQRARMELPRAIVLDVELPGMSGLDVCRQLKADPQTRCIPVLFCSARPEVRSLALLAGGHDFLDKSQELLELPERLSKLLKSQRLSG